MGFTIKKIVWPDASSEVFGTEWYAYPGDSPAWEKQERDSWVWTERKHAESWLASIHAYFDDELENDYPKKAEILASLTIVETTRGPSTYQKSVGTNLYNSAPEPQPKRSQAEKDAENKAFEQLFKEHGLL